MSKSGLPVVLCGALALTATEAEAIFYGNDVHQWCHSSRPMALAYSAALVDQSARIAHILDVIVRPPESLRSGPAQMSSAALDLASH